MLFRRSRAPVHLWLRVTVFCPRPLRPRALACSCSVCHASWMLEYVSKKSTIYVRLLLGLLSARRVWTCASGSYVRVGDYQIMCAWVFANVGVSVVYIRYKRDLMWSEKTHAQPQSYTKRNISTRHTCFPFLLSTLCVDTFGGGRCGKSESHFHRTDHAQAMLKILFIPTCICCSCALRLWTSFACSCRRVGEMAC